MTLISCEPAKSAWSRDKMGKASSGECVEEASPGYSCNQNHMVTKEKYKKNDL